MPSHRILLIDPFKNLLNAYKIILEGEKYCIEVASNLKDACPLLEKKEFSLIITEYIPPIDMTDHLIEWVKSYSPNTYIILLTNAILDEETYEKLYEMGINDIIFKPSSPGKVLVHIKKGLKQRELFLKIQSLEKRDLFDPIAHKIQQFIFNSGYFKKCFRQELKKARRHNLSLSILIIQVPTNNEGFILELARILRKSIREEDIIGKENGNFRIIFPHTNQIGSQSLVARITSLIQAYPNFQTEPFLKSVIPEISFQSYTYPDQFNNLPDYLNLVVEQIDREFKSI